MLQRIPAPTTARLLRAGDRGWLVELPSGGATSIAAAIHDQPWAAQVAEVVPAAKTVLVTAIDCAWTDALGSALVSLLEEALDRPGPGRRPRTIEIPVHYDGPDLTEVADALGLGVADVAREHAAAEHVVGFFGFAPGFAYIDGCPDVLALPRRTSPRTRIEAGYVAIAGNQTVVYPGGTPGGWHLIGHTERRLWNPGNNPPNRLEVGDRVAFRVVTRC
ncbi:5-oxoprolinase subunit B family protein [Saccharopolyspora hattusasensis]|uniref:5-oxoprolinase subunit B family protein n=1 Tax=Saccharopolyspora hattusasensis TaxID=1128679 RepID=UPI003D978E16